MRDYDDDGVPYVVIERSGSGLFPFVWGALLGAAAALLLAPKSGAETQEELKERARRLRERAEGKVGELQGTLQEAFDTGRQRVEEKYEDAKVKMSEGRERAQKAIDAGRRAARAARSEIETKMAKTKSGSEESTES